MQTNTLCEILQCPDCGGKIDTFGPAKGGALPSLRSGLSKDAETKSKCSINTESNPVSSVDECVDNGLQCTLCKRNFETKNDILLLLPANDLPVLSIYDDVNYKKYHAILSEAHDYFYDNPNPIIRWVQHSFYQSILTHIQNKEHFILETGCGPGKLFKLNPGINYSRYIVLDIDLPSLELIENKSQLKAVIHGTSYKLPFCSGAFDRVVSCAQLEHLCYLDVALQEVARVLKPDGEFVVSVPTEGGFLWSFGRRLTSARYFGKKLGIDYIKANRIDHCNTIHQIDRALRRHFAVKKCIFFPFKLPSFDFNVTCTYIAKPLKERS